MQDWPTVFQQAMMLIGRGDPWLVGVMVSSLQISAGATACAALVGLPLAGVLAAAPAGTRRAVAPVLQVGATVPGVLIGVLLALVLGRPGSRHAMWGVGTPFAVGAGEALLALLVIAAQAEPALTEARERLLKTTWTLGAGSAQVWWLLAGEVRERLAAAVVAGFARVVGEAGSALILGGAGLTMAAQMVTRSDERAWERVVALGVVLSLFAIVAGGIVVRLRDDGC